MSKAQDLSKEFDAKDLEWRISQSGIKDGKPWGKCLAYVDARAVQERLDSVMGVENWKDEYVHVAGGVICRLSIRFNNEWITKENGSDETDIEKFKGGISKALVRAASTWGIGRYLYAFPVTWAFFVDYKTEHQAKIDGKFYYWIPPSVGDRHKEPSKTHTAPKSGTLTSLLEPVFNVPTIHPEAAMVREHRADSVFPSNRNKDAKGNNFITEPQQKRFYAIAYKNNKNAIEANKWLNSLYKMSDASKILSNQYELIVNRLEGASPMQGEPPPILDQDLPF